MLPQNICNDIKIVVRDLYRKQEIGFRVAFEKKGKKSFSLSFTGSIWFKIIIEYWLS